MNEQELTDAIASLRRVARQLRADRNLSAAMQIEQGPLAEREAELAALTPDHERGSARAERMGP